MIRQMQALTEELEKRLHDGVTPTGRQADEGNKEIYYLLYIAKRAFRQAFDLMRTLPPSYWPPILAMIEVRP